MESRYDQSFNQNTVDWKPPVMPEITADRVRSWIPDCTAIENFQRDGAVKLAGMFDDWVDPLRAGLQRNMDAPDDYAFPCDNLPGGAPGRYFDSYCNWLLIPEYFDHVTQSCAASMAGQLMRSTQVQFFHEHAFSKEPGTQHPTPWHQDLPYYCVDGAKTVSLYVALDRMPVEIALQFAKGSHRWEKLYRPVTFLDGAHYSGSGSEAEPLHDFDGDAEDFQILSWALEPGDCIAFDFRTLHGTTAGKVESRRRAVSTRWLGDDVVYVERSTETSPPYDGHNLSPGDKMRDDWFPVLWKRD